MNRNLMLAVATVLVLIAVPLAGCVGGSGQAGSGSDGTDDVVDDVNETAGQAGDDLQAHVHDRWDGADKVAVVDQEITIEPISQDHPQLVEQCRRPPRQGPSLCFGTATVYPDTDGETGAVVPPGTEKVDVTLDFGSGFEQVRVLYQDRMSQGQWQRLGSFESGDTMTIEPVPVVRSDDGHAKVSAWKFLIEPEDNPWPAGDDSVWYGEGTVDVTIEAHRAEGELPLEPAHPDFWEETSTYKIGQVEGEAASFVQVNRVHTEENTCGPGVGGTCAPTQLNSNGIIWSVGPGYRGTRQTSSERPDQLTGEHTRALVPPESQTVAAQIDVDGSTQAPVEVCLRVMTSPDQGPYGEVVGECKTYSGGQESWTIERAVSEREVDSFYTDNTGQNASRWTFLLQVRAPKEAADQSTVGSFDGTVSMSVFVSEEASFSLPTWTGDGS